MYLADTLLPTRQPSLAGVMARFGSIKKYGRGCEIYGQGEGAELMHGVASGAARTTRVLADGRRQIGDFYYGGDMIGLEIGAVHRFSAEALTDCSVLVIRRKALLLACRDGGFDHMLLEATQHELERTQEHLLALEGKSASERVARFLLGFAPGDALAVVVLAMGRQDIADYLDLTLETVSRMVSRLQAQAVVKFNGPREFRVLRRAALEELAA
jgi:CRP/FNR family nitrogen fixation transcriptional regulator